MEVHSHSADAEVVIKIDEIEMQSENCLVATRTYAATENIALNSACVMLRFRHNL